MKIKYNTTFLWVTILLIIIEILIAVFLKTGFIRHTFGDYLVVILLYCFFKSFIDINSLVLGISVLILAFIIELLQLINILEILGLQHNHLIKLILGSTFHFSDLIAYTLGIISILIVERKLQQHG